MLMDRKCKLGDTESFNYWKTCIEYTEFISDGFSFLLSPYYPQAEISIARNETKRNVLHTKTDLFLGRKKLSSHGNIRS